MPRPSRSTDDDPVGRGRLNLDEEELRRREAAGEVLGYRPIVDYDALDARTVLLRVRVAPVDVGPVAERLRDAGAASVFELTGRENVLAICRFSDDASRESLLADLAADSRVHDISATVALRTVLERDDRRLL